MKMLRTVWSHLRAVGQRRAVKQEIDEELRFHLEQRTAENIAAGMPPEEAARAARRCFGNIQSVREECHDVRGASFGEATLQDIRFGLRMLRKNPGFTFVAVLTLALGIGANTTIFSAVNTLLLRPLPVKDIDHLAFSVALREGFDPFGTSLLEYEAFRDRSHSFSSIGLSLQRSFNMTDRGEPERVQGAAIQAEYLTTLGVNPILGRSFTAEENRPGGPAVALMGYGLWRRRFGADAGVVGRPLNLEGRRTTIIGVLPPSFDLPNAAEVWIPLQTNIAALPLEQRAA